VRSGVGWTDGWSLFFMYMWTIIRIEKISNFPRVVSQRESFFLPFVMLLNLGEMVGWMEFGCYTIL
jgi:hypothetical protein